MENICDFKNLSLKLYGKEVEIILKEDSAIAISLGYVCIKGILAGRLWGDKITNGRYEETVIALSVEIGNRYIEIQCRDMVFLKPA